MTTFNLYADNTVVAKLKNRRIYIQRRLDTTILLFVSLQEEPEADNPYWDSTSKPRFGLCITKKAVHITNESANAVLNGLLILENPKATQVVFNPIAIKKS